MPALDFFAGDGEVRFFLAAVAVEFSAGAGDGVELHHVGLHAEKGTLLVGAVADVLVLHRVAHAHLLAGELRELRRHQLHETAKHGRARTGRDLHAAGKYAPRLKFLLQVAVPAVGAVGVLAKPSGEKAGVLEADRALVCLLVVLKEARVVGVLVGECGPVVFEVVVGEFFFVPLVGLEQVECEVLAVDVHDIPNVAGLLEQFCVEFFVPDELGLELFGVGFVHAELAVAAGVGVGVAQLQV